MNIRQKLGSANPQVVANTTYGALNIIQQHPPEAQLMATSLLCLLLADSYGLSPMELHQYTSHLLSDDAAMKLPEFKALFAYVDKEIPKLKGH